ncbi:hypothetical protein NECAME_08641 [Necator americanus]|uniref:Uncharacterized protein n=1 Tax=Necator americanus TaxID=51031 RepID=W2TGS4_NECAM|nr:hypothetical protein NECAME_08641 [Necator americanus]ETN81240.1 hypothetical protein NECAME_08641 [Necator americanus]
MSLNLRLPPPPPPKANKAIGKGSFGFYPRMEKVHISSSSFLSLSSFTENDRSQLAMVASRTHSNRQKSYC